MSNLLYLPILEAAETTATAGGKTGAWITILMYVIVIGAMFYFFMYRPQKKQQRAHDSLLSGLAAGDSVLTSSGFYGVVIDVMDEIAIIEFGNNKNCRIPVKKDAIIEVEKPEDASKE